MKTQFKLIICCLFPILLCACNTSPAKDDHVNYKMVSESDDKKTHEAKKVDYADRLPSHISTGEKTILVDPNVHAWGAYNADGELIRAGLATAGDDYCADIKRSCRTSAGSYRIQSLGNASCKSSIYPLPNGGAPMPYCMFFNGDQGLHGSYQVVEGNVSHGCVRMHVEDAKWIRYNFANIGTKVIVKPY